MKFIPRRPREGINVSDVHPLVEAGTLILGLTAIFAVIALVLVFLVDLVLLFLSTEKEAQLFSNWSPGDLIPVAADDERANASRELIERLGHLWPDSPYEFRLEVSQADVPNAMAFPGGLIIVTTGLLDQVETENELAFVLGHELGHFHNRDHIRALGRAVVLGSFFQSLSSSKGETNFGLSITDLAVRGFSRKQETSADDFGLELVYAKYGHVNESWRFFDRMKNTENSVSGLATYLSTHPAASDRIASLKSYAAARDWSQQGPTTDLAW